MKKWIAIVLIAATTMMACNKSIGPERTSQVNEIVNEQQYVFVAETAHPSGGSNIRLSQGFDLRVTSNSVVAYLPFYGRAYTAPMDPTQGGIKFTSTRFQYNRTANSKSGWDITIKPEDVNDVQELHLSITAEGYGNLHVTSSNRQGISFSGQVMAPPVK
jgi:hypothetical protein